MITRWINMGRGTRLGAAAAYLLGCGSGDPDAGLFGPVQPAPDAGVMTPEVMPEPTPVPDPVIVPPIDMNMEPPVVAVEMPEPIDPNGPGELPGDGACKPALGVSGTPGTISEVLILLNTLPRPTSLACFLEALERPLSIYMTKSDDSLQPSPDARSPRTFILRGDLELSIVFDGLARDTLEFGYHYEPGRTIKAEIVFPLTRDVSESSLFDRVQVTPRTTQCGVCHVGELKEEYPGFPLGVFASDVIEPFPADEVSLEAIQAEAASCDEASEPYRCGLLSALFEHGELTRGALLSMPE
jgi:hypothetical protein